MKKITIDVEGYWGSTIMSFSIDENFNIENLNNCSIADEDGDYFNGFDKLIRIQSDIVVNDVKPRG